MQARDDYCACRYIIASHARSACCIRCLVTHFTVRHDLQELEDRKTELDERGSNISDSTPVVRIKAAIKSIKNELQQMSVHIGVLQHQLLQVLLAKSRERLTADVVSG